MTRFPWIGKISFPKRWKIPSLLNSCSSHILPLINLPITLSLVDLCWALPVRHQQEQRQQEQKGNGKQRKCTNCFFYSVPFVGLDDGNLLSTQPSWSHCCPVAPSWRFHLFHLLSFCSWISAIFYLRIIPWFCWTWFIFWFLSVSKQASVFPAYEHMRGSFPVESELSSALLQWWDSCSADRELVSTGPPSNHIW